MLLFLFICLQMAIVCIPKIRNAALISSEVLTALNINGKSRLPRYFYAKPRCDQRANFKYANNF